MGRRRESTAPPSPSSMGFNDRRKTRSRPNGSKPSSTGDADTSASTSISASSSSSGASESAPCSNSYVRLLHDEQDTRLPLSHAGRLPPESTHYSRRSSCNDALPAARLDGRGDGRPSIRRINSDHIGGSFQRRPISRSRGESSGRGGRSPLRSSSPPVSGCGRHPTIHGRHTYKERHMSRGARDISRQRSASTGRPTSSRGRPAASNVQPTSSRRPPSRGRPYSNSRPVMNSGGGRSQSRGRDRSPPAYSDSKALVLRRRSMSPPHRDPRGVNRQGPHPRQPSSDTRGAMVGRGRTLSKSRSASNSRPRTDGGKSRSRSRGRARTPPAYAAPQASVSRKRSMSDTQALVVRGRTLSPKSLNLRPRRDGRKGGSRSRGRARTPPAYAAPQASVSRKRSMSDTQALVVRRRTLSPKSLNLRPRRDGRKGRSRSRGRARTPPAYAAPQASVSRKRSMSDTQALVVRRRTFSPKSLILRPRRDGGKGRSRSRKRAGTPPAYAAPQASVSQKRSMSDTQALVVRRRTFSPKSNWQSISNGCPPDKSRSASNLRPMRDDGKGRSRSRGASLVRRHKVEVDSILLGDPSGRRPRRLRSRRPPSIENNLMEYKPNRGRRSDSSIPSDSSSRTHLRQSNSKVGSSRGRSPQLEVSSRSPPRSRSIAPDGVDNLQKSFINTVPQARSGLAERSSSRYMTGQKRDNSLERIILSTLMRTLSVDSFDEERSRRRENSTDRRSPEWSGGNAHTQSKTEDFSKQSHQVSTSTRRKSSPKPRSPSLGWRIREESSERMQSETMRRDVSLDSFCDEPSTRRVHSSASQRSGISMRSRKTCASSTNISYCPTASIEKRSPDRSSDKSQPHRIQRRHRYRRANEQNQHTLPNDDKKTKDEKLTKVKSAEEVQSKPCSSSAKALLTLFNATPPLGQTSPPEPGVPDISLDDRQSRASAAVKEHNVSSNSIAGPLSHGDLSPSSDPARYPRSRTSNKIPRTTSPHPGNSARNQTPPPPPRKQTPPPPPPPRTNDASSNMRNGTSTTTLSCKSQEGMIVQRHPSKQLGSIMRVQQQPDCQYQEAPEVGKSKEWMKYTTKGSRQEITEDESEKGKRSKLFGRGAREKSGKNEQIKSCNVKQMPFTDQFGDFGYYTGQVDDEGRPNGKGVMKYENGVFYEGTWVNGCQDKLAASQYERIRGGFTSWSGKGKGGTKSGSTLPWNANKNDAFDGREKTNVRGLDWTDLNGGSGRYTGEVDNDQLPHGSGIMRYDYGLIAEGEWVHGVLKEGPHDRMISAAAMNGGQSVAPGMPINSGMSVGPGAIGYAGGAISVLGAGGMSVAPPVGFAGGMGLLPVANPMQFRGMNASQHAMLAHQNAMMNVYGGGGGGSVYHGGVGSVYGGTGMIMPIQQMPPMPIQPMQHVGLHQHNHQQQQNHQPPISNIVIK